LRGLYIDDQPATDRTTDDRPLIKKISNDDISATGHPIHAMFDSGRRTEWRYFHLDQLQYECRRKTMKARKNLKHSCNKRL